MPALTIDTPDYLLYPSPRNPTRVLYAHQHFVPHPYALIHLPDYALQCPATLFVAQRKSDGRMGQLVSCESAADLHRFIQEFSP